MYARLRAQHCADDYTKRVVMFRMRYGELSDGWMADHRPPTTLLTAPYSTSLHWILFFVWHSND